MKAEALSVSSFGFAHSADADADCPRKSFLTMSASTTIAARKITNMATTMPSPIGEETPGCRGIGPFMAVSLRSSSHQHRLVPVHQRRPEKNNQHGRHSQECPKWQFVIRFLAARQNEQKSDHTA